MNHWKTECKLTPADFTQRNIQLEKEGYSLVNLASSSSLGETYFSGTWVKDPTRSIETRYQVGLSKSQIEKEVASAKANGWEVADIVAYSIGSDLHYAAVWKKTNLPVELELDNDYSDYQLVFNDRITKSLVPTRMFSFASSSEDFYISLWQKGNDPFINHHGMNESEFQTLFEEYALKGYQIIDIAIHNSENTNGPSFSAIWNYTGRPSIHALRTDLELAEYEELFFELTSANYSQKTLCSYNKNGSIRYAALWAR